MCTATCEHVLVSVQCVCDVALELPRVRGPAGWAAHKTKQAMTKHLALLASLGKLGLSEHMLLEVEADLRRQGRRRGRAVKGRSQARRGDEGSCVHESRSFTGRRIRARGSCAAHESGRFTRRRVRKPLQLFVFRW